MKRRILIYLLCFVPLLAVVFRLTCCSSSQDYRKYLPTDARLVARLDLQAFSDMGLFDLLLPEQRWNADEMQQAGLRTDAPAFAFATAEGGFGLLFPMKSARRFEAWLSDKDYKIEPMHGVKCCRTGSWILAFDNGKLIVMECVLTSDANTANRQLLSLMEKTQVPSPLLTLLDGEQGTFSVASSFDMLPEKWRNALNKLIDLEGELHSAQIVANLFFGDKDISLDARFCGLSEDAQARIDKSLGMFRPLSGNLLSVGPLHPSAWLGANLDGETVLPFLRQDDKIRLALLALNFCVDADDIIRAVNGDVSFTLPKASTKLKNWCIAAQLKHEDFLRNAPQWGRGGLLSSIFNFTAHGERDFSLLGDDVGFCFGVHDRMLYLTPLSELSSVALADNDNEIAPRQDVERRLLYATFDAPQWLQELDLAAYIEASVPSLLEMANSLQRLNVALTEEQHIEVKLIFDSPIKELLKHLSER